MRGARQYAMLFESSRQHGRLYLSSGRHARGSTFHIYVLPEGEVVRQGGHPSRDAVEVYGIVSGQPGWTETYGWLREGPWQADFEALVVAQKLALAAAEEARTAKRQEADRQKRERDNAVLASYGSALSAIGTIQE